MGMHILIKRLLTHFFRTRLPETALPFYQNIGAVLVNDFVSSIRTDDITAVHKEILSRYPSCAVTEQK